ncbi:MAG: DUF1223 domain-containing protein [Magnetovibrionaceae bacterium]
MKQILSRISRPLRRSVLMAASLGLAFQATSASAGEQPVVVELFTSQGCYSCPPAEKLLGELSKQPGILALEWHVDYWDDLIYGLAGKWKDPFSDPAFTQRQRDYNRSIRGTGSVYTPQMVIGGQWEVVGSRVRDVERAIGQNRERPGIPMMVEKAPSDEDSFDLTIALPASGVPGRVLLAIFDLEHTTKVKSGENKGKTLTSHNIVRDVAAIGAYGGSAQSLSIKGVRLGANQGCAVLVQAERSGPILGGAYCPGKGVPAT